MHGVSEEFVDDFVFSLKALDDHKELQNALIGPFVSEQFFLKRKERMNEYIYT